MNLQIFQDFAISCDFFSKPALKDGPIYEDSQKLNPLFDISILPHFPVKPKNKIQARTHLAIEQLLHISQSPAMNLTNMVMILLYEIIMKALH